MGLPRSRKTLAAVSGRRRRWIDRRRSSGVPCAATAMTPPWQITQPHALRLACSTRCTPSLSALRTLQASERDHAALQLGNVVMINNYSGAQSLVARNHVPVLPGSLPSHTRRRATQPLQGACVERRCDGHIGGVDVHIGTPGRVYNALHAGDRRCGWGTLRVPVRQLPLSREPPCL